jgi:protein gp37
MPTAIEWTDETWNPVTGCSKVSPGCAHCYAERISHRYGFTKQPWTANYASENVVLHPERLAQPLSWKKSRRVFVNSMSDLFHEQVSNMFIMEVFSVMAEAERHTFQILTKRPERMRSVIRWLGKLWEGEPPWPLPNVWLGVSAEYQRQADERIPLLLQTAAAVRFVSLEPLLGPIDLGPYLGGDAGDDGRGPCGACGRARDDYWMCSSFAPNPCNWPKLDWVIVGGESGGPEARRLLRKASVVLDASGAISFDVPEPKAGWVRSIRDQCNAANVAFLFKQWGGPTPKSGGRLLDGRTWDEYPQTTVTAP